ncbi:hypothetical protein CDD82_2462 [Ophiocordyceps australis]|uniref:Uncharacterized protein n=1 Tax=Ophiocordyceps australis TaxID=1399860 RepID=A0A2C5ZTU2_9HYPO|nr:hypothetical protein CDD82_2462 [Ophiocordyceps australis]
MHALAPGPEPRADRHPMDPHRARLLTRNGLLTPEAPPLATVDDAGADADPTRPPNPMSSAVVAHAASCVLLSPIESCLCQVAAEESDNGILGHAQASYRLVN